MLYYFLIMIWVILGQVLNKKTLFRSKGISILLLFSMFLLMSAIVFLQPYTGDMKRYLEIFSVNQNLSWLEAQNYVRWEPGFVTYQWVLAQVTASPNIFILSLIIFMWFLMFLSFRNVVSITDLPIVIFGYLSFFYFYNFSTNILRQGIAVPLVLLMIVNLSKENFKKAILIILVALSFHISSIVGIILIIIKKFNISLKILVFMFLISAGLLVTGFNENLMLRFVSTIGLDVSETVVTYSSDKRISNYGATNRIDFLLFTSFWILWGLTIRKYFLKDNSFYEWLLKSYVGLSSIYILFGFIAYSDRLASYAWFLIPLIMIYPITKIKEKSTKLILTLITVIWCIVFFFYFNVHLLYEPLKILY